MYLSDDDTVVRTKCATGRKILVVDRLSVVIRLREWDGTEIRGDWCVQKGTLWNVSAKAKGLS